MRTRTHRESTTLAAIAAGPDTFLRIECLEYWLPSGNCHHSARLSIVHAIVLFGSARTLNTLRFTCSRCGSELVDIRPAHPIDEGGGEIWPAIDHHRRKQQPRWTRLLDDPCSPFSTHDRDA